MAFSAGGDGGGKPVRSRIANAKRIGWAIYAAGSAIWLFGYLSAGHAPLFDWDAATPWWISSFVPNLEAELGVALRPFSFVRDYLKPRTPGAFFMSAVRVALQVTAARWRAERLLGLLIAG